MPADRLAHRVFALVLFVLALPACAERRPYVELDGHRYGVEIVEDDASRARGLMERTELPAERGMLFVFQDDAPRAFWMKNTKIPLDILYFNAERQVVSVQHDVQPCHADPCPAYPSGAPARYVLELNAGEARRIGVTSGDELAIHR